MMISTRGRYALRVMIDLALNQEDRYLPLKEIAERQGISEKYLESIVKSLVRRGFLTGLRGKGGGYRLTRTPAEYTIGSILLLTEGSLAPVACVEDGSGCCPNKSSCPTFPMWKKLDQMIQDFFEGITLQDLMNEPEAAMDPQRGCPGKAGEMPAEEASSNFH